MKLGDVHRNIIIIIGTIGVGLTLGITLRAQLSLPDDFRRHVNAQLRLDSAQNRRIDIMERRLDTSMDSINRSLRRVEMNTCELVAQTVAEIRACRQGR